VIQFLRPSDLDTWMQRGGRGGRGGVNLCRSTLLVQPSALEKPKKKKSNPHLPSEEIEGHEFHDEVERDEELRETGIDDGDDWEIDEEDVDDDQRDVLWRFITTDECLWTIIDRFYKNPAREGLFYFHNISYI
jgi:hypothetical protein